jgi:hypothetical protein
MTAGLCRGVIPASSWLKSNPRRNPTDEVAEWQCVPAREGAEGQDAKDRAVNGKLNRQIRPGENVVKLQAKWKPPVATDRGNNTAANVPRVMPDGAVWKRRGVNSGGLSCQRIATCPGMDAPGDQEDAKTEPSQKHQGEASKSGLVQPSSSRKSGGQRGVGASIVPSPRRGTIDRREEDEKAKLVRGKGTQGIR